MPSGSLLPRARMNKGGRPYLCGRPPFYIGADGRIRLFIPCSCLSFGTECPFTIYYPTQVSLLIFFRKPRILGRAKRPLELCSLPKGRKKAERHELFFPYCAVDFRPHSRMKIRHLPEENSAIIWQFRLKSVYLQHEILLKSVVFKA